MSDLTRDPESVADDASQRPEDQEAVPQNGNPETVSADSQVDSTADAVTSRATETADAAVPQASASADAERRIAELTEQLLRMRADFENYKRRMDPRSIERGAIFRLMADLLPIIDDFERAIAFSADSRDFEAFYDGIGGIERKFVGMLERKWDLQRFEPTGEEFDPERHEALMSEPSTEVEVPTVSEVFQRGYLLDGKILRTAQVKVSMPEASSQE